MQNNRKHLPWETVEQILHNLPVKSLLRFKCVSKSWRSLISDKSFVKRHLDKSSTDERLTHHRIIVRSDYHHDSYYNLATCSLGTLFDERNEKCPTAVTTLKHCPIAKWCFGSRILGTCNGLILMFADTGHLFLWNPSIRDAENIPLASFDGRCDSSIREFIYGFGYDEANDDYKVVCFYIMYSKPFQTKIFSLRGKYWKKIENFENGFPYCGSSGKLVNGKLHWIAEDGCDWWDIVSFNFSDEKFEIVPRPRHYSNEYIRYFPKLVSLGGYLGFIGHEATIGTSVWVMMKYGEAESWTRVWMTRSPDDAESLWFTKNGDIAVAFESSDVVVCNGEKTLRKFRVDVDDAEFVPKVYVESLVSPRIG